MRILFLGNNWVGLQVLRWLRERDERLVGLVMNPPHNRKYGEEIIQASGLEDSYIFNGSQLCQTDVLEAIRALEPDIGISVLFGYILQPDFLSVFPSGCINLHPALLPYNRGTYPNVWSIVDRTPAGVTLHYMDAGVDTGDIVAQSQVPIEPVDAGATLHHKLEQECVKLFTETWALIKAGTTPRIPQDEQAGTYHRAEDVDRIDRIDLDRTYVAGELIDILRARTFPPYPGSYFLYEGRKVYLRLQLFYEEDLEQAGDR